MPEKGPDSLYLKHMFSIHSLLRGGTGQEFEEWELMLSPLKHLQRRTKFCLLLASATWCPTLGNYTEPLSKQVHVFLSSKDHRGVCHWCCCCQVAKLCLILRDPMDCSLTCSSVRGDSAGKNTGVGCHFLLQGIFPTQELNPHLMHWQANDSPGKPHVGHGTQVIFPSLL